MESASAASRERLLGRLRRALTGSCPRLRLEVIVRPKPKDVSTIVPAVPRSCNNIGRGNRRQVQVEILHFGAPVSRKHRLDARTNGQSSRGTGRTRPGSAVLTAHLGSKSKLSAIFVVSEGCTTSYVKQNPGSPLSERYLPVTQEHGDALIMDWTFEAYSFDK